MGLKLALKFAKFHWILIIQNILLQYQLLQYNKIFEVVGVVIGSLDLAWAGLNRAIKNEIIYL